MARHVVYKGPSVIKEVIIATGLGLVAGGFFKVYQWKDQKKTREFYELLNKGDIIVVREDE